jgi:hypothetical protein
MHIQNNNVARTEAPSDNRNEINGSDVPGILEALAPSEARLFTPSDYYQKVIAPVPLLHEARSANSHSDR